MSTTLRTRVRAAVAALPAADERAQRAREAFLEAFDRLAEPFAKEADPVHVTGSAIVVGPRGVLLHRHKRMGVWLQPGGHLDEDETPWAAAARETAEETGLTGRHPPGGPELVHVDVHPAPRGHTHLDLRYLLTADGQPAPAAGESQAVRWFPWGEAVAVADPGLAGGLAAVRRRPDLHELAGHAGSL